MSDPFQTVFAKFWSVKKRGSDEWELLALLKKMDIVLWKKKTGERSRAIFALLSLI